MPAGIFPSALSSPHVAVASMQVWGSSMGDAHDTPATTDSPSVPTRRRSLSLAILIACVAGWAALVSTIPPQNLQLMVLMAGVVLAMIFGWRRSKGLFYRVEGAVAFFAGALFFAYYSEFVAGVIQGSFLGGHRWHLLDAILEVGAVAAGAPLALFAVYIMWLSWNSSGTKAQ